MIIRSIFFLIFITFLHAREETFILIDGHIGTSLLEIGSHIDTRVSPCSTFKIPLSLMGFDAKILEDEDHPVLFFQEGFDDYLPSWKDPQTPKSWMKLSCVWYSRVLAEKLTAPIFSSYLSNFQYGNQDMSGGLTNSWLNSSLQISPREQVVFLQKMVQEKLSISTYATKVTKNILFIEELSDGSKLFGKTGYSGRGSTLENKNQFGWFIGWVETKDSFFPFAYIVFDRVVDPSQRIPRTKQFLKELDLIKKPL